MRPKSIKALNAQELAKLPEKRLLAYLKLLQTCQESEEASDWTEQELSAAQGIVFKNSELWRKQHQLVKTELSQRPHITKNQG